MDLFWSTSFIGTLDTSKTIFQILFFNQFASICFPDKMGKFKQLYFSCYINVLIWLPIQMIFVLLWHISLP